jgi:S-adenosylmethionine hydrolase
MIEEGVVGPENVCRMYALKFDFSFLQGYFIKYVFVILLRNVILNEINKYFSASFRNSKQMHILTLTTDLGESDQYVAALKGAVYALIKDPRIIDISHSVRPFDVVQAAFLLSSCIDDFPEGTVHVMGVDSEPIVLASENDAAYPSIMTYKGQFVLGSDNGFFGVFAQYKAPDGFFRLDDVLSNKELYKFPIKNIFIPVACKLLEGAPIDSLASPHNRYRTSYSLQAITEVNLIKGNIIHIDAFGNLITNVQEELFNSFEDAPFTIYYRNKEYFIDKISTTYSAVAAGERLALFNSVGLLEIAVNRGANGNGGGADKLFGVRVGDVIRIEFTPRGSRTTLESLF